MLWLDEILTDFCSKDRLRDLQTPLSFNGFTYATNGWSFIRVPNSRLSGQYREDEKKALIMEATILQGPYKPYSVHLFTALIASIPTQPEYGECEICNGDGVVECYACHHEHECEECDGSGRSGQIIGHVFVDASIVIGGKAFSPKFIKAMAATATIVHCLEIQYRSHDRDGAAGIFEMNDVIVGIMPRALGDPKLIYNLENFKMKANQ